jgi:Domain of unknown function (DUF5069)
VQKGGSDEEILEWCYVSGHRPNAVQERIWNTFASKMGWNDPFSAFMETIKVEEGLAHRDDLTTAFAVIAFREDRAGEEHDHSFDLFSLPRKKTPALLFDGQLENLVSSRHQLRALSHPRPETYAGPRATRSQMLSSPLDVVTTTTSPRAPKARFRSLDLPWTPGHLR